MTIFESPAKYIVKIFYSSKVRHFFAKLVFTTSLYKPIKLGKLKSVLSQELHYMPDGPAFEVFNDKRPTYFFNHSCTISVLTFIPTFINLAWLHHLRIVSTRS